MVVGDFWRGDKCEEGFYVGDDVEDCGGVDEAVVCAYEDNGF